MIWKTNFNDPHNNCKAIGRILYWGTKVWNIDINVVVFKK